MSAADLVAKAAFRYRMLKEEAVEEQGGPADTVCIIEAWENDDVKVIVGLPDRDTLSPAVLMLRSEYHPTGLVFCADAFMKTPKDGARHLKDYERGDFQQEFEAGSTDVTECLICVAAVGLDDTSAKVQPYHYQDGKVIFDDAAERWGDQLDLFRGLVVDELRLAWDES